MKYTNLPENFDNDGAFLNKLLIASSNKLGVHDRLVIVVDALDEIEHTTNTIANPLYLPAILPENVYIVVSTRRTEDFTLHASNLIVHEIDNSSRENMQDIRAYIESKHEEEGIKLWKKRVALTDRQFVDVIAKKSEGNFMYLRCILHSMTHSRVFNWTIDELPQGLRAYYRKHWKQMQMCNPSDFDNIYKPVICVLAATYEAVSSEQIAKSSGLEPSQVEKVLKEWAAFIHKCPYAHKNTEYRIYHNSFCDFLQEEVDPQLSTYHAMIAKSALSKIRRRKEGLSDE